MNDQEETDVNMEEEANNEEEANKIRKIYRNIREQINENRLQFVDPNSNAIEATLENVERTFKSVKKAREAVSDSHILLELARLGKERIRNVHCEFRSFNNVEFMDKIKVFMAKMSDVSATQRNTQHENDEDNEEEMEENENDNTPRTSRKQASSNSEKRLLNSYVITKPILTNFGKFAMNYFKIPPRPTFLLGSLDRDLIVTQKKQRQRRQADQTTEEQKTKIKEIDAKSKVDVEENSTIKETDRIFKILKRAYKRNSNTGLCFYEFVINPKSFTRTIENIFYVSFLVKDGYAKISLDDYNLPMIEPNLENDTEDVQLGNNNKKPNQVNIQSMISLTKLEWQEIIKVFNLEQGLIPDPV